MGQCPVFSLVCFAVAWWCSAYMMLQAETDLAVLFWGIWGGANMLLFEFGCRSRERGRG